MATEQLKGSARYLSFPFRMDKDGGRRSGRTDHVREQIAQVLLTAPGERVFLPLFGIGIVFGAIWAEVAWGRFWGWDAKETVSMITWILYAAYLHARATAGWKATGAAWINVFAMAMTIFNMTYVNTVIAGLHSYAGLN